MSVLSSDRINLALGVATSITDALGGYAASLRRPEKRLELGAWIAVIAVNADRMFLNPPPVDPKVEAAIRRQGPVYGYMGTVASILNPFWVYGAYSLLAQQMIERLGVPKSKVIFSNIVKTIEGVPVSIVGNGESHWQEFARGLVASTVPNATLPFSAVQLAHAAVLKVT